MIANGGRCEERHLFGKCGSGWRASGRHSTGGEVPLRIPAAHDVRCMYPRAEADWCPCTRRVDCVVVETRRCEELHLFAECGVAGACPAGKALRVRFCCVLQCCMDPKAGADCCGCCGREDCFVLRRVRVVDGARSYICLQSAAEAGAYLRMKTVLFYATASLGEHEYHNRQFQFHVQNDA